MGHAAMGVGDKSESMVLKEPGSVLMTVAHVTTDGHTDVHDLCYHWGDIDVGGPHCHLMPS